MITKRLFKFCVTSKMLTKEHVLLFVVKPLFIETKAIMTSSLNMFKLYINRNLLNLLIGPRPVQLLFLELSIITFWGYQADQPTIRAWSDSTDDTYTNPINKYDISFFFQFNFRKKCDNNLHSCNSKNMKKKPPNTI